VKIFVNLPLGVLDDPKKLARDVSKIGHWGNGDYEISIDSNTDIDYLMFIIKQSIQYHSK
jgi:predicted transport protein